ncbi:MAG: hypothetical protein JO114_12980 [Planctomycetaceae bacterium]|nr:hypothetical protein [Planctomycetaceae bacterium]
MDISKPQGSWVHVEQVGDELVLRWRAKWFAAAFWFAVFLLLPAFCVFLILTAPRAPTLNDILSLIFFLALWIPFGYGYPLRESLGTERLRIGSDGLDYQARALNPAPRAARPARRDQGHRLQLEDRDPGQARPVLGGASSRGSVGG